MKLDPTKIVRVFAGGKNFNVNVPDDIEAYSLEVKNFEGGFGSESSPDGPPALEEVLGAYLVLTPSGTANPSHADHRNIAVIPLGPGVVLEFKP